MGVLQKRSSYKASFFGRRKIGRVIIALLLGTELAFTMAPPGQAAPPTEDRVVRGVVRDSDGVTHTRYERTLMGKRVVAGDYVEHADAAGHVMGTSSSRPQQLKLKGQTAKLGREAAIAAALSDGVVAHASVTASSVESVWYNGSDGLVPAFDVLVVGLAADATPVRTHVYVDGLSGAVVDAIADIMTDTGWNDGSVSIGTTRLDGPYLLEDSVGNSVYDMNHKTSGSGRLMTDVDDVWGDGTNANTTAGRQSAGVDAQFGAEATYNYYFNTFGRKGIWDTGVGATSQVHYGNNYKNAFWDAKASTMVYGDNAKNANPLTEIDVAAHEMTHGVTLNTANLTYRGESGGLNESTSDIFGTAVEFSANLASDIPDYLIGEKTGLTTTGALRFMDKPSRDGNSPDCWSNTLAKLDVHYSSGPLNHWFYLTSEGSGAKTINGVSYNSPTCNGSTVSGVGRSVAEKVWYRALTVYLTSASSYKDARDAAIRAAKDLFGDGSTQCFAVENAMKAINAPSGVQTCTAVVPDPATVTKMRVGITSVITMPIHASPSGTSPNPTITWLSAPLPGAVLQPAQYEVARVYSSLTWSPTAVGTYPWAVRESFPDGWIQDSSGTMIVYAVPSPSLALASEGQNVDASGIIFVDLWLSKATASDTTPSLRQTSVEDPASDVFGYVDGDANSNGVLDLGERWHYQARLWNYSWWPTSSVTRTVRLSANDSTGAPGFADATVSFTISRPTLP